MKSLSCHAPCGRRLHPLSSCPLVDIKLDVMPNRAAASEIALPVEDLIAPIARNRDPYAPAFECELLPITVGNVVHVPIQCRPICESLSSLQPSSSPGLGIS